MTQVVELINDTNLPVVWNSLAQNTMIQIFMSLFALNLRNFFTISAHSSGILKAE
jgi:hypothetical protein